MQDPTPPRGPLADITVIDASWLLPGQFTGMILSDLGARVIKIELPGAGDYSRSFDEHGWAAVNRRKQGLTLNLRKPGGLDVLLALVDRSDVLLEGFRPGVMDRLGAGWEVLSQRRPELVYCSVSGYGQDSEDRLRPGHGLNYAGVAGLLSLAGDSVRLAAIVTDLAGSLYAAVSILAALRHREAGGAGQHIDLAITDAAYALMTDQLAGGHPDMPQRPPVGGSFGVFTGADGVRFTVGAVEDGFWRKLCEVVGHPGWAEEPRFGSDAARRRHASEIRANLGEVFATRPGREWLADLDAAGVPAGPFNELSEARRDPYALARELISPVPQPGVGEVSHARFPALFSTLKLPAPGPAPSVGEHSEAILAELGYDTAGIAQLRADGTI